MAHVARGCARRRRRDVCGSVHEMNGEIVAVVITVCVVISVSVRATSFRVGSNNTCSSIGRFGCIGPMPHEVLEGTPQRAADDLHGSLLGARGSADRGEQRGPDEDRGVARVQILLPNNDAELLHEIVEAAQVGQPRRGSRGARAIRPAVARPSLSSSTAIAEVMPALSERAPAWPRAYASALGGPQVRLEHVRAVRSARRAGDAATASTPRRETRPASPPGRWAGQWPRCRTRCGSSLGLPSPPRSPPLAAARRCRGRQPATASAPSW